MDRLSCRNCMQSNQQPASPGDKPPTVSPTRRNSKRHCHSLSGDLTNLSGALSATSIAVAEPRRALAEDADTVDAADNIVESVEQDTFGARLERLDSEQERAIRAQGFNATPRSPTPLSDRMPAPEPVARSPPSRPSEHESVTGAAAANELSAGTRSTAEGASRQPSTAPSPTRMHSRQPSEHGNGLGAAAADELPAGIRSVTGGAGPQFSPTWYPTRTHSRQPIEHSSGLGAIAAAHGHSKRAWSASGGTSPQVKSS
ncbi:hypothetical protein IWZ01DRAFT_477827 [Phyllosticta capitalensis]